MIKMRDTIYGQTDYFKSMIQTLVYFFLDAYVDVQPLRFYTPGHTKKGQ